MNEVLGFTEGVNLGLVTEVQNAFVFHTTQGVKNIEPALRWLFVSLFSIRFVMTMLKDTAKRKNPIRTLFELAMFFGGLVWIFNGWVTINDSVMYGFVEIGLRVSESGITLKQFLNPSNVLVNGMILAGNIAGIVQVQDVTFVGAAKVAVYNYLGIDHGLTPPTMFQWVVALFVILSSFIIAAHLTLAILEYKFSLLYTMFMVAAGVLTHTKFSLKAAIRYNFATGMRLFILATMTAISEEMWENMIEHSGQGHLLTYNEMLSYVFASITLALLSWMIPNKVANFVQGGPMISGVEFLRTAYKAAETTASAVNPKAAAAQVAKTATAVAMKAVNPGNSTPGTHQRDKTGLIGTTKESTIAAAKSGKGPKLKQAV